MPSRGKTVSLLLTHTKREKQKKGGVRQCQSRDFADSIFTHQTELFPVSTWPNSRCHHLTPLLLIYFYFITSLSPSPVLFFWPFAIIVINFYGVCFPPPACCHSPLFITPFFSGPCSLSDVMSPILRHRIRLEKTSA